MTGRPLIDLEEAKALVRKACTTYPDNINPTSDDGVCLYNSYGFDHEIDPDGTHCIAGTIFIEDLGIDSERLEEETSAANMLRQLFPDTYGDDGTGRIMETHPALALLNQIQNLADGGALELDDAFVAASTVGPRKWGEVLILAEGAGLL